MIMAVFLRVRERANWCSFRGILCLQRSKHLIWCNLMSYFCRQQCNVFSDIYLVFAIALINIYLRNDIQSVFKWNFVREKNLFVSKPIEPEPILFARLSWNWITSSRSYLHWESMTSRVFFIPLVTSICERVSKTYGNVPKKRMRDTAVNVSTSRIN